MSRLSSPYRSWDAARKNDTRTRDAVRRELDAYDPDVIFLSEIDLWDLVPTPYRARAVVDLQDDPWRSQRALGQVILRRLIRRLARGRTAIAGGGLGLRRAIAILDRMVSAPLAARAIARSGGTLLLASREEALGRTGYAVVPNGADEAARPVSALAGEAKLLFPAQFNYMPNRDGVEWLATEVLPHVRRFLPSVEVVLAGNSGPELAEFGRRHRLTVTGYLDSLDEVYRRDTVVIVPLLSGAGTRVKILEAWARGLPIVSTTKGAEGLDVRPGSDSLIADDPRQFAMACVVLLLSDSLRCALGSAGRRRFSEGLSWDDSAQTLRTIMRRKAVTTATSASRIPAEREQTSLYPSNA